MSGIPLMSLDPNLWRRLVTRTYSDMPLCPMCARRAIMLNSQLAPVIRDGNTSDVKTTKNIKAVSCRCGLLALRVTIPELPKSYFTITDVEGMI